MRLLMIGPPGAGKGTQAARIATYFGVPHIATGDLLRSHVARGTELGEAVRGFLDRGSLVPDQIVLELVRHAFVAAKTDGVGYVLDGYPRTTAQAWEAHQVATKLGVTAEAAVHLRVDDSEVVQRLLARASTEHRSDDTESVIRRRLALYHEMTQPVLDWYDRRGILLTVDGMRSRDDVTTTVIETLELVEAMPPVDLARTRPVPILAAA